MVDKTPDEAAATPVATAPVQIPICPPGVEHAIDTTEEAVTAKPPNRVSDDIQATAYIQ